MKAEDSMLIGFFATDIGFGHIAGNAIFVLLSVLNVWVSWSSLRRIHSHGFYRFFVWEFIIILLATNINYWFQDPFQMIHIISWIFLIVSLILIFSGVLTFRKKGNIDNDRNEPLLLSIEKTTQLVTTGIYRYIRHPFYSSLLFLGWGIFLKNVTLPGLFLTGCITILIFITAGKEEIENQQFFGEAYQRYMKMTKRFIPFVF